ncbi:hypothetical protein C0Q70_16137 [Pomacea canaliculata]|uniref:Uncharacterized protein n=1 Tax=Pomacea canaliculata TaxID=400727 RepID=A0A2T7NNY5_POMCA|nr:hypothetical protein C0Q70_16137 [Pomacea canaliculata]
MSTLPQWEVGKGRASLHRHLAPVCAQHQFRCRCTPVNNGFRHLPTRQQPLLGVKVHANNLAGGEAMRQE